MYCDCNARVVMNISPDACPWPPAHAPIQVPLCVSAAGHTLCGHYSSHTVWASQVLRAELRETALTSRQAIDSLVQRHCAAPVHDPGRFPSSSSSSSGSGSSSSGSGSSGSSSSGSGSGSPAYLRLCQQSVVERVFGPLFAGGAASSSGGSLSKDLQGVLARLQQVGGCRVSQLEPRSEAGLGTHHEQLGLTMLDVCSARRGALAIVLVHGSQ